MKLSSVFLIASSAIISSVHGFSDTAPFYSSQNLKTKFPYIIRADELAKSIDSITAMACNGGEKENLVIYRVSNLSHDIPSDGKGTFIKHVFYEEPEELDLQINGACNGVVEYSSIEDLGNSQAKLTIVDVEDGGKHDVEEFINSKGNFIVQGKPTFNKLKLDKKHEKRQASGTEPISEEVADNYDDLMAEVELDLKAAESFLAQESEEAMVTIFNEPSAKPSKNVNRNSNLFTNYQFFTPGIWQTFIVSAFLLFVLYTALGWMTSLEISYKSFDKQVDFEKKTE